MKSPGISVVLAGTHIEFLLVLNRWKMKVWGFLSLCFSVHHLASKFEGVGSAAYAGYYIPVYSTDASCTLFSNLMRVNTILHNYFFSLSSLK